MSQLLLLLHVGKKRFVENGEAKSKVYLSDLNNRGCHFSAAFVDISKRCVTYGDSLGWEAPTNLLDVVESYTNLISPHNEKLTINYYHVPTKNNAAHLCSPNCSKTYPLQRDGNVCGIVAIIMASIASLDNMDSEKYHWLVDPTRYNKFLRLILICWFSEEKVDLSYL